MLKYCVPLFFLITLGGCATSKLTRENLIVTNSYPYEAQEIFGNKMAVAYATEKPTILEIALFDSLKKAGLLAEKNSDVKYYVSVRIVKESAPSFGLAMSGNLEATFVVSNSQRSLLFSDTISSEASAEFTEKLNGYSRAVIVIERYVKSNISSFIDRLAQRAGELKLRQVPPLINPSTSTYNPLLPLASLTELALENLPENRTLKTQTPPPAGYSSELDETQTRWCIYESIRLQIIRGNQKYSLVREKIAEHRTACGAAKINTRVESIITSELLTVRPILQRQGAFYLKILSVN